MLEYWCLLSAHTCWYKDTTRHYTCSRSQQHVLSFSGTRAIKTLVKQDYMAKHEMSFPPLSAGQSFIVNNREKALLIHDTGVY